MRLVFCGGSQGLVLAARSQLYRGGLSSPASQPTASLFMGSIAIVTFSVRRIGSDFQSRLDGQRAVRKCRPRWPRLQAPAPQRRGRAQESRFAGAKTNDDQFYRRQAGEAEEQAQRARNDLDRQPWLRISRDWRGLLRRRLQSDDDRKPEKYSALRVRAVAIQAQPGNPLRERWTGGRKQVISRHCLQSVVRRGACPEFSNYNSKSFGRPS